MPRSSSTCSHLASRISRSRAPVSVSRRIAATEWRSNLRRRFSGFGACFALGFDSSGRLRGCERVAEAEKLVLGHTIPERFLDTSRRPWSGCWRRPHAYVLPPSSKLPRERQASGLPADDARTYWRGAFDTGGCNLR